MCFQAEKKRQRKTWK